MKFNYDEYNDYMNMEFEKKDLTTIQLNDNKLFFKSFDANSVTISLSNKDKYELVGILMCDLNKDNQIHLSTGSKDLSIKEIKL